MVQRIDGRLRVRRWGGNNGKTKFALKYFTCKTKCFLTMFFSDGKIGHWGLTHPPPTYLIRKFN